MNQKDIQKWLTHFFHINNWFLYYLNFCYCPFLIIINYKWHNLLLSYSRYTSQSAVTFRSRLLTVNMWRPCVCWNAAAASSHPDGGHRTQVLTTKMCTFFTTVNKAEQLKGAQPAKEPLLTRLENLHGGRFLLQTHDENRLDHDIAVEPSLVAAAAAAQRAHRSSWEEFPEAKTIILRFWLRILRQSLDSRSPELMIVESLLSLKKFLCLNYSKDNV